MSSPLRINPDALPHAAKFGRDAASAWLDRVTAMLRVPASERDAIRAELNEHLRERIRDLMLAGASEQAATSQAISELGDAASLARRYQEAIEPSSRRSLMHVGIATAATAALVFSGAALVQNGGPSNPTPATSPVTVAAPTLTPNEEALARQLDDLKRAINQAHEVIAQQERELARARGEAESMQMRVRLAEEQANALQREIFETRRQYDTSRESASRAREELAKLTMERDSAMERLAAIEKAAVTTPPAPPAAYAPRSNPAREFLRSLKVDVADAATLGAIMSQPAIRDAKVYLRNHRHAEWSLVPPSEMALPERPLSLGEVLDVINANSPGGSAMMPRAMPDGRIAIDTLESWDREERVLVIYDLSDLVARAAAKARTAMNVTRNTPMVMVNTVDQLRHVITDTVTPDIWQDNGGDIGAISVLDSSLVVTAPERSHDQIRFLVEQLRGSAMKAEIPLLTDVPLLDASRIAADHEIQPARKHDFPAPVEAKDAR